MDRILSDHLCGIVTVAMDPEVVETQHPKPDNKHNAEDGVGDAQKMSGSGYLLLVLFPLAFFY